MSERRKKVVSKTPTGTTSELVQEITEQHGGDVAMVLGDPQLTIQLKGVCSTQCATLDEAIGRGGVPYGRLTVLAGPEGGGKTTVALHICSECQKQGGIAYYLDTEYKLDPEYATKIGVNINDLIISQPLHLEQCLGVIETTIDKVAKWRTEKDVEVPMVVVLDSMTAAPAKCELEGNYDDRHYAPQANVMTLGLKKLIGKVSKEKVALIFISQLREKVGVVFGAKEDTTCGRAPKFYASLGVNIKRKGKIEGDSDAHLCEAYVWKNQIAPPFKRAEFVMRYGVGIDRIADLWRLAQEKGLVKAGGWLDTGKDKVQGLAQFSKNPKVIEDVKRLLK